MSLCLKSFQGISKKSQMCPASEQVTNISELPRESSIHLTWNLNVLMHRHKAALWGILFVVSETLASLCTDRFLAEYSQLRDVSFTSLPTHGRLPGMAPSEDDAKHPDRRERHEKRLDALFKDATSKLLACRNLLSPDWSGGRFWYLEIGIMNGTLCAPAICNKMDMETTVAQAFVKFLGVKTAPRNITASEILPWSDLPLDFVVIGLDGCGSTTLHQHLKRHNQVGQR